MELKLALKVHDADNVATVFAQGITSGSQVEVRDTKGHSQILMVIGDVPYGHKIALKDIAVKSPVIKYGEELGEASAAIKTGEYVHAHNLESRRGRGDLGTVPK
ncbi:MAG: UxaA family hydrolase [Treponemataceae bacterium]|nr:MAG: UxaA family hydrolase [Treponemataceae bacterium]